jgi:hypothetical protein
MIRKRIIHIGNTLFVSVIIGTVELSMRVVAGTKMDYRDFGKFVWGMMWEPIHNENRSMTS